MSQSTQSTQPLGTPGSACRICVSVAAPDEAGLGECLAAVAGADLIEVRLDALHDPLTCGEPFFADFKTRAPAPLGFTCRPVWEGGGFAGDEEARRALLERAANSGAAFVDVEQDAAWSEDFMVTCPAPVILSHHWSSPRPPDLIERVSRMRAAAPAVAKLVAPAETPSDAIPMLRAGADLAAGGQSVAAFCIGAAGAASRVLAVAEGAALIYAAQPIGTSVAAGQWAAERLRYELLLPRWRPGFACCALAGHPVDHSLSPAVFNASFAALQKPFGYLPIAHDELEPVLELAEAQRLRGLSITMPFKEAAARRCADLDPLAAAIGAVNTLVWEGDGWRGFNTDAGAISAALAAVTKLAGCRVAILGAGGAARAAAFALAAAGADLTVCNRTRSRADDLAEQVGGRSAAIGTLKSDRHDVIINATPIGMEGRRDQVATPLPVDWLRGDEIVFDFVYRPRMTPLLRAAGERGCRIIEGLEMFLRQAAEQYRLWIGDDSTVPLDIMRQAAEKALQRGGSHEITAGGIAEE